MCQNRDCQVIVGAPAGSGDPVGSWNRRASLAQPTRDQTLIKLAEVTVSNLRDAEKYMVEAMAPDQKPDEDDQPPFTLYGEAADIIERLVAAPRSSAVTAEALDRPVPGCVTLSIREFVAQLRDCAEAANSERDAWHFDKAAALIERLVTQPEASAEKAEPIVWIAFSGSGYVRFWTSDGKRAEEEKRRGMDLRGFTLDELVALICRIPAKPQTVKVTDEMVNAAAREIWNDSSARMGGSWSLRDPKEVVVVQTLATARAALNAALAVTRPQR
jgi:hypothetical protein